MARLRKTTIRRGHQLLGDLTVTDACWDEGMEYLIKWGVWHLLVLDRREEAEERMLDIVYMAHLCASFETFVTPLKFWRVLGLSRAEAGYQKAGEELAEMLENDPENLPLPESDLLDCAAATGEFLTKAGLLKSGLLISKFVSDKRQQLLGPDHPDTLNSLNTLALVLHAKGDYEEAEKLHRQALAGRQQVLGPDHQDTLNSLHNLAIVLQEKGDFEEAEKLQRQALAGRQQVLGPDHPDMLRSLGNLANVLQKKGDLEEAKNSFDTSATPTHSRQMGPRSRIGRSELGHRPALGSRTDRKPIFITCFLQASVLPDQHIGPNVT